MKDFIKKIIILFAMLVFSYFSAFFIGDWYDKLFPSPKSIFLGDFRFITGLPLSYTFFLSLLFTAFCGAKKYWWIGILLIPAVIFEVYFDLTHIYFPILLGLVGWALGWGISKLMPK